MVHAAVGRVGPVLGGPDARIGALLDALVTLERLAPGDVIELHGRY